MQHEAALYQMFDPAFVLRGAEKSEVQRGEMKKKNMHFLTGTDGWQVPKSSTDLHLQRVKMVVVSVVNKTPKVCPHPQVATT